MTPARKIAVATLLVLNAMLLGVLLLEPIRIEAGGASVEIGFATRSHGTPVHLPDSCTVHTYDETGRLETIVAPRSTTTYSYEKCLHEAGSPYRGGRSHYYSAEVK